MFRWQILQFRRVMADHGDGETPLWLTEIGWGSAPPDRFGINKGLAGQAQMLRASYRMILDNRAAWNLQRLFWYHWRDPPASQGGGCSFCASAGLLTYDRTPKPAYNAFTKFAAETIPPGASITGGAPQGSFTKDSSPSFSFTSTEAGSTFVCRLDAGPYEACSSPYTTPLLSDGRHVFVVRAIDATGNESVDTAQTTGLARRHFTVDTAAPAVTIRGRGKVWRKRKGSATFTLTVSEHAERRCRVDSKPFKSCSRRYRTPRLGPGTHALKVKATDRAGNVGRTRKTFAIAGR